MPMYESYWKFYYNKYNPKLLDKSKDAKASLKTANKNIERDFSEDAKSATS